MNTNKLLNLFHEQEKEQGFLQLEGAENVSYDRQYFMGAVNHLQINGEGYYLKAVSPKELDAELILGPIYKKHFKSAIYLPARHGNFIETISNDVLAQDCLVASNYFKMLRNTLGQDINPFLLTTQNPVIFDDFVEDNAMRQMIIRDCLNLGFKNWDGHKGNFAVRIVNGRVAEIIGFDNEASAVPSDKKFHNIISEKRLDYQGMLQEYQSNEIYRQFILPTELAEIVGSVDIDGTAERYTQLTGHNFDQDYLDEMKFSTNKLAEDLEHC